MSQQTAAQNQTRIQILITQKDKQIIHFKNTSFQDSMKMDSTESLLKSDRFTVKSLKEIYSTIHFGFKEAT